MPAISEKDWKVSEAFLGRLAKYNLDQRIGAVLCCSYNSLQKLVKHPHVPVDVKNMAIEQISIRNAQSKCFKDNACH